MRGETVTIPSRICQDEPVGGSEGSLTPTQQVILHCLYSRHGDGLVRPLPEPEREPRSGDERTYPPW